MSDITPPSAAPRAASPRGAQSPRAWLAFAIVMMVAATEVAVLTLNMANAVRDILQIIVGVLIGKFGTVYDYYFGASKSDSHE